MTKVLDLVLADERDTIVKHESDGVGDGGSLCEVVEVSESEALLNLVVELDLNLALLIALNATGLLKGDATRTLDTSNGELDALLSDRDLDVLTNDRELLADALELSCGHANNAVVDRGGNTERLHIDVHELQGEARDAVLVRGFEDEVDVVGLVLSLEGDRVVGASAAKNLGHVLDAQTEVHVAVNAEVFEALSAEGELDQGDERRVDALEGDTIRRAVKVTLLDELTEGLHELGLCSGEGGKIVHAGTIAEVYPG